jgi:hypothetical protein
MRKKLHLALILILVALAFISCKYTDRIVIDGEVLRQIAFDTEQDLFDFDCDIRGNSLSNLRNGGYVLVDNGNVYFITEMVFDDNTKYYYLQHLLTKQIGSIDTSNNIIAQLNGSLLGIRDGSIFYLNKDDSDRLYVLNLQSLEQYLLFEHPLNSAHLIENKFYVSTSKEGDLYELEIIDSQNDFVEIKEIPITLGGGTLVGITKESAFMVETSSRSSSIRHIDLNKMVIKRKSYGGPYKEGQLSGSWLFYLDQNTLLRQHINETQPIKALNVPIGEYAICHSNLVFTGVEKGIYLSRLDGSSIEKISDDKAVEINLFNNLLFYKNQYDNNSIYVIDLEDDFNRKSLLGETMTDGGIKFFLVDELKEFANRFDSFVLEVASQLSPIEYYWQPVQGPILFAEITDQNRINYYRHIDDNFRVDEVKSVVVITDFDEILGQYTDGYLAYRSDKKLTLFSVDNKEPITTFTSFGRAPTEIKTGPGDRRGLSLSWHNKALELYLLKMP